MKKELKLEIAKHIRSNLDDIHFNFRSMYGYDKFWNIVFSEREPGKTTAIEVVEILLSFLEQDLTSAMVVRNANEITEDFIDSIESRMNKMITNDKYKIKLQFMRRDLESVVSVKIDNELVFKIIPLNIKLRRLKGITILKLRRIVADEYVIDPQSGEKYLTNEWFKLNELVTTLRRNEYKKGGLKVLICGNPYSKFTPVIVGLGVDTNKMKSGALIIGNNYIVNCYKMNPKLKEEILKNDPRYKFDDTYRKYAFDGEYKNDTNIRVGKLPNDYSLRFVFNIRGLYLGIFKNNYIEYREDKYFVKKIKFNEVCRTSYCFDFNDLMNGSVLISNEERQLFAMFKSAMRERRIVFESVECYYLIEEIYKQL